MANIPIINAIPISGKSPTSGSGGSLPRNHSFQDLNSLKQSFEDINLSSCSPCSRYEQDFSEMEEVGSGGFGKVFKVKNKLDEETYAIKKIVFKKKISHSQLKKVLREVKALARLDHPNVVRYFQAWIEERLGDIFSKRYSSTLSSSSDESEIEDEENEEQSTFLNNGRQDDEDEFLFELQDESFSTEFRAPQKPLLPESSAANQTWSDVRAQIHLSLQPVSTTTIFIQMQLCEDTLQNWLDVRTQLDYHQNLSIFKQICKGLKYIHSQNIIHRDLKPANIFLSLRNPPTDDNDKFMAVLGDFGLAVNLFEEEDDENVVTTISNRPSSRIHTTGIGTHTYASPEMIDHKRTYDSMVDVFGLGIILFELFYIFTTKMERSKILTNLRKGILPENFDPKVGKTVLWLLANDPKQRPSVSDILESELFQSETVTLSKEEFSDMQQQLQNCQSQIQEQQKLIEELRSQLQNQKN